MIADIIVLLLLVVVVIMTIGIYFKTSDQARSLRALDNAAQNWLAMQIRKAREAKSGVTFDKGDALRWLSAIVGTDVTDAGQVFPDFRAVEAVTEEGETVLVTAMPEDEFRRRLKQAQKSSRLEARVAPSLPRKAKPFTVGLSPHWVYFDLEAAAVGKALGLDWGQPERLWVWAQ